jgi:hypothetical protein
LILFFGRVFSLVVSLWTFSNLISGEQSLPFFFVIVLAASFCIHFLLELLDFVSRKIIKKIFPDTKPIDGNNIPDDIILLKGNPGLYRNNRIFQVEFLEKISSSVSLKSRIKSVFHKNTYCVDREFCYVFHKQEKIIQFKLFNRTRSQVKSHTSFLITDPFYN